jgi:hypothetical protein
MRRKLFTLCSAVSLLLCMAVCGLWLHSSMYLITAAHEPTLDDATPYRLAYIISSSRGSVWAQRRFENAPPTLPGPTMWKFEQTRLPESTYVDYVPKDKKVWDFEYSESRSETGEYRYQYFGFPWWAAFVASAMLPLAYGVRMIDRCRRTQPGLCPACGYDLRATPDRCPECGAERSGKS